MIIFIAIMVVLIFMLLLFGADDFLDIVKFVLKWCFIIAVLGIAIALIGWGIE